MSFSWYNPKFSRKYATRARVQLELFAHEFSEPEQSGVQMELSLAKKDYVVFSGADSVERVPSKSNAELPL